MANSGRNKNTGSLRPVFVEFDGSWIGEFAPIVRETQAEHTYEEFMAEETVQAVKDFNDRCRVVVFTQESKHHLCLHEVDRKKEV